MASNVLVCEDREPLRELFRSVLEEGNFSVVEARDGIEGLRLARSARPQLVVLDMVLPGMSGLDVLTEIRSNPALTGVKVILCTAHRIDPREAKEIGADRVLVKPFPAGELLSAAQELIAGR